MERKGLLVMSAVVALAALALVVALSGANASASLRTALNDPELLSLDFGDAPEDAIAYPAPGVLGQFPTCQFTGLAAWVQHTNFGAFFGSFVDFEPDGNAGACAMPPCFPPYDLDECFQDGDAGLIFPEPFTLDAGLNVVPCPNSQGTPLGSICQAAAWGANVDIHVTNRMPNGTVGYANLLVDWDQDGDWNDVVFCPTFPGVAISEHALVDFPVPNGFSGPLSQLTPPNFLIGPNLGHAWARFTITEVPVGPGWTGDGGFEDGESEDYLLAIADTDPGIKWSQLPNRSLTGQHAHDYLDATGAPESLTWADDWLCQGGEVTDLHWWGNYELDDAQQERRGAGIASFHLSIHAPSTQDPCLPAEPPLWQAAVPFGMVSETDTGLVNIEGSRIYKYTYYLPQPFAQTAGGSYWFDISAISVDINNPPIWRWQESARTTNPAFPPNQCGAAQKQTPPGNWLKMVWAPSPPGGLPRFSEMAFEVTSMAPEPADWGDAPDGAAAPGYPTLAANNGARHTLAAGGPFMGAAVDPDPDGQPTAAADGDDADADGDDEDSVSFTPTPLRWADPWPVAWVDFSASPAGCYVNGWLDFNGNSNWNDPGEQIVSDFWMAPGNSYGWSFAMPDTPPFAQGVIYTRFRCSTAPGLGPDGPAADGEVEDHAVPVAEPLDWGDAPDTPYPTLSSNNGASHLVTTMGPRLGVLVDVEMEGQSSAYADGDDQLGLADEDGVLFTTPLLPGRTACVDVTVDPAGVAGVLDGWIDFDGDGAWAAGPPEQVFSAQPLVLGLNSNLCFAVPAAALPGFTYARFRISSQGNLPPTGPAADGEVEDYRVRVEAVKWSQPPVRTDPDPTACYWGWDELSRYEGQQIVADDWRCEDARPVTDIHWWGSYREWELSTPPQLVPVAFHLGIWTDVPANPEPFSHPGVMIWDWIAPYPEVHERAAGCDFHPGMMQFPDTCFEYHVDLPPDAWFFQEPDDHVYWLSISAIYPVPGGEPVAYPWGWKTRPHFFNDDAVRILAPTAPQLGMSYESGEPIMLGEESWDLAFVLTTATYDYGDAADPTYPTLLASDGARHAQVAVGPLLGHLVDAERDGQPDAGATGDDLAGLTDEDGVSFLGQLEPGQPAWIQLSLAGSRYGCHLNAWIDFNRDGVWDNSAGSVERIATDFWLYPYGVVGLQATVPSWPISAVGLTDARFRCASATGLGPTGPAADGEVEDYQVQIIAPPRPPVVSIAITNTTGVRLSWPPVALDVYGNSITPDGYHIYRATAPYAALWHVASVWAPFPPGVIVWDDTGKVGNPAENYYYTVDAVLSDINGYELYSVRSNEVAEFDFALTPGGP